MAESEKPRLVGLNHIALEVGDIEEALPSEYAAAKTWHDTEATPLPADATVRVALARN
jgi:hypothetical protein